jgi:hypothetical protein
MVGALRRQSGLAGWTWVWIGIMIAGIVARAAVPYAPDGAWADAWDRVARVLGVAAAVLGTVIVVVQSALSADRHHEGTGKSPPA